ALDARPRRRDPDPDAPSLRARRRHGHPPSAAGPLAGVLDQDLELAGVAALEVRADHGPQDLRRHDAGLALDVREVDAQPQARGAGVELEDPQVRPVAAQQAPGLLDGGGDGGSDLARAHGGLPRAGASIIRIPGAGRAQTRPATWAIARSSRGTSGPEGA